MLDQRIDLSYDFQASFDVYLGNNANGADGLAFVLQNDPLGANALGAYGGNYGAIGIKNGLGIAFDTWQNAELGDMAADHTDLFKTGVPSAISRISDQIPIGNGNVTDGQWHNVLVSWSATDHTLNYWFDGQLVGQLNQDIVANYLGGSQYAYLGFTAGTGGAHNLQEVHLNSLTGWFEGQSASPSPLRRRLRILNAAPDAQIVGVEAVSAAESQVPRRHHRPASSERRLHHHRQRICRHHHR